MTTPVTLIWSTIETGSQTSVRFALLLRCMCRYVWLYLLQNDEVGKLQKS